jgi:AcrR family transcriptional regulator
MNQVREKRQVILDIATRIFSRYGYAKTSLDEIAHEARIAKGTIYYYFPSKEDLFMHVVEAQALVFVDEMHQNIRNISGFENKLRYFMHAPLTHVCEKMPLLVEGLKTIPFNLQQHFEGFREENRTKMLSLLMGIFHFAKIFWWRIKRGGGVYGWGPPFELSHIPGKFIKQYRGAGLGVSPRLCEVINDWFLMGNLSIVVVDFEELLQRIQRDHEVIIQLIMYGIMKRG